MNQENIPVEVKDLIWLYPEPDYKVEIVSLEELKKRFPNLVESHK